MDEKSGDRADSTAKTKAPWTKTAATVPTGQTLPPCGAYDMREIFMHEQHRQRLKDRFLKEGLDNFNPHNIIELLLFYTIPRKDTNELAHRLEEKFGSLSGLFEADFAQLAETPGIGRHTATLFKLIPELWRVYSTEKLSGALSAYDFENAGHYLINKYIGVKTEIIYMMLYDNKGGFIDCVEIHEGTLNSGYISPRRLAEVGFGRRASCFILAHNHPDGNITPSEEDIKTTRRLNDAFAYIGMPMIEHIIVAGEKFLPLIGHLKI